MGAVTLRFVAEHDPISWAIREITWCEFSHVEFVLDDGTTLGARASGGVRVRPADYARFNNEERYRIPLPDGEAAAVLSFARDQIGKPYDFADIGGILFHRDWRCPDHWICSELVAAAFECALPLVHAPHDKVHRISPADLYLSARLIGHQISFT